MNLQSQVCTLDLAKRLKELGVKQESAFYWINRNAAPVLVYSGIPMQESDLYWPPIASAFTVAELGEQLKGHGIFPVWQVAEERWVVYSEKANPLFSFFTEADARAVMLIYLIEQGLVKP